MKRRLLGILILLLPLFLSCNSKIYQKKYEAASKTADAADNLLETTSRLNSKIEGRLDENPNSATRDFVTVVESREKELDQIKRESGKIQKNRLMNSKAQFEKLRQFQDRLNNINYELDAINTSLDKELDKKLSSDISFATGSYKLSDLGKEELKKFILNDVVGLVNEWNKEEYYKDKKTKIKIIVAGYADLQGPADVDKRKQLNLQISRQRAESVKNELQNLLEDLQKDHKILVEYQFEGKGEEPPPGITDINKVNNAERRVCMISSYVIPEFN